MEYLSKLIILIFILSITFAFNLYAQDSTKFEHYNYGFGASMSTNLYEHKFYFPMYIHTNFRIEPEIDLGIFNTTNEDFNDRIDIEVGIGTFYRFTYHNLEIYPGFRFGYLYLKSDAENINNSIKSTGFFFTPTIGGEYFLFERFSLGAELQFKYIHRNEKRYKQNIPQENTENGVNTYTFLIMRFYVL
jgi:hypothetical protein